MNLSEMEYAMQWTSSTSLNGSYRFAASPYSTAGATAISIYKEIAD